MDDDENEEDESKFRLGGLSSRENEEDESNDRLGGLSSRENDDSNDRLGGLSSRENDDSNDRLGGLSSFEDRKWLGERADDPLKGPRRVELSLSVRSFGEKSSGDSRRRGNLGASASSPPNELSLGLSRRGGANERYLDPDEEDFESNGRVLRSSLDGPPNKFLRGRSRGGDGLESDELARLGESDDD